MKFSLENNGNGFVLFRVSVPENLAFECLDFVSSLDRKTAIKTPSVKSSSCSFDENYLTRLTASAVAAYSECLTSGMLKNQALSSTLLKLKGNNFYNISYDSLKSILTKEGCFRSKTL